MGNPNRVMTLEDRLGEMEGDLVALCEDNEVMKDVIRCYFKSLREEEGIGEDE